MLRFVFLLVALTHITIGAGLMFSQDFQRWSASVYGVEAELDIAVLYLVRVLGSFIVFVGVVCLLDAIKKHQSANLALGLITLFAFRNLCRWGYSAELYSAFGVPFSVNVWTTVVFSVLIVLLLLGVVLEHKSRE